MCPSQLKWHKFPVGTDGFVCLVDTMGNDDAVVQAARLSYNKDYRDDETAFAKKVTELYPGRESHMITH